LKSSAVEHFVGSFEKDHNQNIATLEAAGQVELPPFCTELQGVWKSILESKGAFVVPIGHIEADDHEQQHLGNLLNDYNGIVARVPNTQLQQLAQKSGKSIEQIMQIRIHAFLSSFAEAHAKNIQLVDDGKQKQHLSRTWEAILKSKDTMIEAVGQSQAYTNEHKHMLQLVATYNATIAKIQPEKVDTKRMTGQKGPLHQLDMFDTKRDAGQTGMSVQAFMKKYLDALISLMESVHAGNLSICSDKELDSEAELLSGKWALIIGTYQAAAKLANEETKYSEEYQCLRKLLVDYNVHVGQSKNQDLQLLVVNELQALEVVCIRLYSGPMYKRYLCI